MSSALVFSAVYATMHRQCTLVRRHGKETKASLCDVRTLVSAFGSSFFATSPRVLSHVDKEQQHCLEESLGILGGAC